MPITKIQRLNTLAVHAGEKPEELTGGLRTPIQMSTTFKLPNFGIKLLNALTLDAPDTAYVYTRWSNPTLDALEERLAAMEGSEAALVTASGVAAVSTLLLTYLGVGDHLIASEVCYAGSIEFFGVYLPRLGIEVSLVDTTDPQEVKNALQANTRIIYIETPANPLLFITDIQAIRAIARECGALLIVDSTFAGPTLQRPLDLGADYVVYSLTKYINGHGDALGGAILGSKEGIHTIRKEMLIHLGGAMSPFNAWLIQRGMVTLPLRMKQHCASARRVAEFLDNHPKVSRVIYPGLATHPQYELASRQMADFGGMISFQLRGGLGAAISLSERIRLFSYATSLGHAHSLVFYYPTDVYFESAPYLDTAQKKRIRAMAGEGVVRASIGLEDPEDLIADLDQALNARTFKGIFGPLAYKILQRG